MEESYFDEDTARRYMHDIISGLKYRRTWMAWIRPSSSPQSGPP